MVFWSPACRGFSVSGAWNPAALLLVGHVPASPLLSRQATEASAQKKKGRIKQHFPTCISRSRGATPPPVGPRSVCVVDWFGRTLGAVSGVASAVSLLAIRVSVRVLLNLACRRLDSADLAMDAAERNMDSSDRRFGIVAPNVGRR